MNTANAIELPEAFPSIDETWNLFLRVLETIARKGRCNEHGKKVLPPSDMMIFQSYYSGFIGTQYEGNFIQMVDGCLALNGFSNGLDRRALDEIRMRKVRQGIVNDKIGKIEIGPIIDGIVNGVLSTAEQGGNGVDIS